MSKLDTFGIQVTVAYITHKSQLPQTFQDTYELDN